MSHQGIFRLTRTLFKTLALLMLLFYTAGFGGPASAAGPWYVDGTAGTDNVTCGTAPGASACATVVFTLSSRTTVGDTINVAPGTYNENFAINFRVTLRGAKAGIDARTRSTANESILNVPGRISVLASGTVIDGFTIQSQATNADTAVYTSSTASGYQILNNIIQNNVFGLYFNSNGVTQSVVRQNLFQTNNLPGAAGGNGIYEDAGLINALIDNNAFLNHTNGGILITETAPNVNANITISNNAFTNNPGLSVGLGLTSNVSVTGNTFNGTGFNDVQMSGDDHNISVTGNIFTNPGVRAVVALNSPGWGSPGVNSNLTISGNTINKDAGVVNAARTSQWLIDLRSPQGVTTVAGNAVNLTGTPAGPSFDYAAISVTTDSDGSIPGAVSINGNNRLNGNNVPQSSGILINVTTADGSSLAIDGNSILGFVNGIHVIAAAVLQPTATNNVIRFNLNGIQVNDTALGALIANQNCIASNVSFGTLNTGGALLNAQQNWWNSATGPGGSGPGSGDAVSTSVDYSSFLTAPILGCPGALSTATATPTATATATVTATATGTATATVTATATGTTTVTATATVSGTPSTATPFVQNADPGLAKSVDPQLAIPGEIVAFTLTVTNSSAVPALNVAVVDSLPDPLEFISASASQGTYTVNANTVTFLVGTVNQGQVVTLTLRARVSPSATPPRDVINIAALSDQQGDRRTASALLRITSGMLPSTGEHP